MVMMALAPRCGVFRPTSRASLNDALAPMTSAETRNVGAGRTYLGFTALFSVLSLGLWWHTLGHLASVTTCGCGDASLTLWVLKWPAYAISHGLNPFYSRQLLVPNGINMAPNSLGLGFAFAPVTWIWGPVATLNVIDICSPILSGLAMVWLLRRWGLRPAAVATGALFFAFSPFVLTSLALAHPNFSLLAPVPVIIGLAGDLLVDASDRRSRMRTGLWLGLAVTVEFLVSVEVLTLMALFAVFTLGVLAVAGLVNRQLRMRLVARGRQAATGLWVAMGVAVALLGYPLWSFFAGPAHLVGRAWPDTPPGTVATTPWDLVAGKVSEGLTNIMHLFGGYQGPRLPSLGLLGFGVLVIVGVGTVLWRHDRRLWLFSGLGAVAVVLSFGVVDGVWTPWRLFTSVPVLNNVVPVNIGVISASSLAISLAIVLDHLENRLRAARPARRRLATWATCTFALLPVVAILAPNLPFTTEAVAAPAWFTSTGSQLGPNDVVLPYPAALGGIQSSMTWQTLAGLTFSMVGGGGPGITVSRAGPERPGFLVLAAASLPLDPEPQPTESNLTDVRQALDGWGVTTIVVPDQPGLPVYDRGRPVPYAVAFFTASLGQSPTYLHQAWIWTVTRSGPPPVVMTPEQFARCWQGETLNPGDDAVAACVLRAA